jgi:tryptophan 2,3-dioxygenase
MNREHFYSIMAGEGLLDYEKYIASQTLLGCQKRFTEFCNEDELLFQVIHQITELWMKSIAYTFLELDECLQSGESNRAMMLFRRVEMIQNQMIDLLGLMDTVSPNSYQEIRVHLGQGSVRESPSYRAMIRMHQPLWRSFQSRYLERMGTTLDEIYNSEFTCSEAYLLAEAFIKYDELFQRWRFHHIQMVHRTIGVSATSLKGNPVTGLNDGLRSKLFPELWEVRSRMTDEWSARFAAAGPAMNPAQPNTASTGRGRCPMAAVI